MAFKPVAVVTGGALGIGAAFSKGLLSRSYRVVVLDMNAAKGAEMAEASSLECEFVKVDVTDWEGMKAVFEAVYKKHGRIDVVAANAGIAEQPPRFYDVGRAVDSIEPTLPNLSVINVDLIAVIKTVTLALFYMRKNLPSSAGSRGKIVVTASAVGIHAEASEPLYTAAKFGAVGLVRSIAPVLKYEGITVNAVCPSYTDTAMSHDYISTIPPELWSTTEQVADTFFKFVDSDMTGTTLEVTAGEPIAHTSLPEDRAKAWMNSSLAWLGLPPA